MKRLSTSVLLLIFLAAASRAESVPGTASASNGASGMTASATNASSTAFTPPPTARELHSAQCVAALEVETEGLAAQVKAGNAQLRDSLQNRLEAGTALVGDAYLHGTRDEARAKALANQALEDQKGLPDSELAARQSACAAEGRKLFDASNGFERAIVKQMAKKRMEKLLAG